MSALGFGKGADGELQCHQLPHTDFLNKVGVPEIKSGNKNDRKICYHGMGFRRLAAFLENPLLEQGAPLLICISKSLLCTDQTRLAFKEEARRLFPIAKDAGSEEAF